MSGYVIRASNITKTYGKYKVLDDLSINIKKGDIYGVIGKNGAGKTTMIRVLTGLVIPNNGQVELFGHSEEKEIIKERSRIGTLIESPALYLNMTAEENLELVKIQRGIPGTKCISETLNLVGLKDVEKKKTKNFSLGMKQRLGIAMALLSEPEFLVLDEPMNGVFSIQYGFEYIIYTSFIFALLGGEFIAKDFKNNNISKSFSYGYTRSKVILSKLIAFIIACLFLEIIYTTILVIYVSINHGFCEVLNLSVMLYLIRVIIIGIMYSAATICIIAMIAITTKTALCTFASPVIFLLIQLFFSNISAYILPYVAGRGAISRFAPKEEIIFGIISSLLTFIITIGVSMSYTRHEDIK
ncbi:ATP-binding cassette domain-containing protein [Clostridium estertheticum]|uniref:ATP-binding cassette domain-containing protein n=1 Tax=Clostridium estertheticum TaxID=238834 RepID=UPI001CF2361A|nr:ATP-binding cassette domain-containing protein [Clostridium estertheticum]MCB2358565.1 ATP-binding cassette domain-containing protein [Clostridium estertheticum]